MGCDVILVAGTDTGVGKTVVACGLASAFTRGGRSVVAVKPVESGCAGEVADDGEDGALLASATGQAGPTCGLFRFREPVTPALAAEQEGVELDGPMLLAATRDALGDCEVGIVEGAGGLRAPLAWDFDTLGLAQALEARVVLVGANALGTLNHTRLSLEVLAAQEVPVAAVVLSDPSVPDPSSLTNGGVLERMGERMPPVSVLPRLLVPAEGDLFFDLMVEELA